ncbi:choline/ethanolamine kinase family protein [Legionella israelensis]|uniref:Choline kinase n=1 Tax=Legionella israelensis TaxID=454 RepID=A0A0W0WM73_9GAMM|nr:choline/ethanolamine kinase family protein [Legionella israelensis]KTD33415.1 choline kinase [Legionella israelensis]QBS09160.1 hypothetical protein E4T55_04400 [Legionella israelensis]SCY29791.1 Thiamine kinase [Legionella israelensis DSM 19235]STX58891.1 choline kinase [Legionella israelensis]
MFTVDKIPEKASKAKIEEKTAKLSQLSIFKHSTFSSLDYLGGCTNHALLAHRKTEKPVVIRLPGSQSELIVDRKAEKYNSAIVASLGLCAHTLESYESGALHGFKVEDFINGQSLNVETFRKYTKPALAALKKIHDCKQIFLTEYSLFERIILMCETLIANGVNYLPYNRRRETVSLSAIIEHVKDLEETATQLFPEVEKVPCHNDISPFNFIVVKNTTESAEEIKILDWEYSGMNDRMIDLAYIASENGYVSRAEIEEFLQLYFESEVVKPEDVDKVLFYVPLIDLKVAVWSLLQVHMRNESKVIDSLKNITGTDRFHQFKERIQSKDYQSVIEKSETACHRMGNG